jgi:hypothetical protein
MSPICPLFFNLKTRKMLPVFGVALIAVIIIFLLQAYNLKKKPA